MLGSGKKVFDGDAVPTNVTLLEPPVAGPKGMYLRYGLAEGTPRTGGHERTRAPCRARRYVGGRPDPFEGSMVRVVGGTVPRDQEDAGSGADLAVRSRDGQVQVVALPLR